MLGPASKCLKKCVISFESEVVSWGFWKNPRNKSLSPSACLWGEAKSWRARRTGRQHGREGGWKWTSRRIWMDLVGTIWYDSIQLPCWSNRSCFFENFVLINSTFGMVVMILTYFDHMCQYECADLFRHDSQDDPIVEYWMYFHLCQRCIQTTYTHAYTSCTHACVHAYMHTDMHTLFLPSFLYSFIDLFIYQFVLSFTHSFLGSFIHSINPWSHVFDKMTR